MWICLQAYATVGTIPAMADFRELVKHSSAAQCVLALFGALAGWWITLNFSNATSEALQLWAAAYQIVAFFGACIGVVIAYHWGGHRSVIGRAILSFSVGLFLQCFGQTSYSFYIYYLNQSVPYPSVGDIGYFGSIFAYLYGALALARAAGVSISLKSYRGQLLAVLLPLLMLIISYVFFLRGYEFDGSAPLKTFLDFGYPFGQALYVSVALLGYLLSRNILGGMMRKPILVFIGALILQYFSDFTFLYQASQGTWYAGGINDALYLCAYLAMTLALLYVGQMFVKIKRS